MQFSIIIPSWNNLPYLQNCIESILHNSTYKHQIIVVVNEGNDGTIPWLKEKSIAYVHHQQNAGICIGLNSATELISKDHLVYLNDDMYVLPAWDKAFAQEIESIPHNQFMLSGTMIEPFSTGNDCVIIKDFGDDLQSFKKEDLLAFHKNISPKKDWCGATWPPVLIPVGIWKSVGGMSEEFSPGMYSDPDLSMKVWETGVRYFKGIGMSMVYHFGSKSTRKLGKNVGRSIFLNKWKMTSRYFYKNYLKMGTEWNGELTDFEQPLIDKTIHFFKTLRK